MTFSLSYKSSSMPDFEWLDVQIERPEPLMQAFASYRESQFAATALKGIDPYAAQYSPLSAMYARQKAKRYGAKAILTASGAMLRTYKVKVSPTQTEETVSANYAGYHQTGTSKMDKRAILPDERGLPSKDQQKLIELTKRFVDEQVGRMPQI